LGFLTRDEVYKKFPEKDLAFVWLTAKLAEDLGFVKPFLMTLTAVNPRYCHPHFDNERLFRWICSNFLPFTEIKEAILGAPIDIPLQKVPNECIRYQISEARDDEEDENDQDKDLSDD
jgi:hypothetical protein